MDENIKENSENKPPRKTAKFKITYVEIFVLFIVIMGFAFYFIPKAMISLEQKQYGRLQTNAAMMTSKVLAEFSDNLINKIPSDVAVKLSEEMNKLVRNPIDKNNPAYSIQKECLGCVTLTPDDKAKNIVLTAKDKENKLVVRTVIQPPSFVTFNKDLNENEQK